MKTVLLCGGFGTRIRDVADDVPKPMIRIGGRPILWHIMKYYATFGVTEFVLCAGYKVETVREFFLTYDQQFGDCTVELGRHQSAQFQGSHSEDGWKVTIADTGLNTMTGGRVSRIRKYIGNDEHFFLTYGDGVSDIDLDALLDFHKSHGKALTVSGVYPPARFGEINASDEGQVVGFNEKPQATGGLISGGYFVASRRLFDYLSDDEDLVFEKGPMQALVEDCELMMYHHSGFWQCMDTYRDYTLLTDMVNSESAPWITW